MKYFGHIICSDLSDDEDMMRHRRHLYSQGNVISRSFHMCSIPVNTYFRIRYFVSFVLPCTHVTCGGIIRNRASIS